MLVGGVFVGVRDLGGFAEGVYAAAEPGADEEGRGCGEEDVAGRRLARVMESLRVRVR